MSRQPSRRADPRRVFTVIALLTITLFKFQNCAPHQDLQSPDPTVGLIDGWPEQKKVAFISSTHLIAGLSQPLEIHGLCVGSAAGKIFVEILNGATPEKVLETQEVNCVMGGFEIASLSQASKSCDDRWLIRASSFSDPDVFAETEVQVDCQL